MCIMQYMIIICYDVIVNLAEHKNEWFKCS